jgi:hypothetical protein
MSHLFMRVIDYIFDIRAALHSAWGIDFAHYLIGMVET